MPTFIDMTGQRFGRLIAILAVEQRHHHWYWCCQCDCGQTATVNGDFLRRGLTKSCGCWAREATSIRRTTHGATRGKKTVEYITWRTMLQRCYDLNHNRYKYYGGRGIKVCKRWHKFENFLADMGSRPAGRYSIERIDVNGDYKPGNCIWLPLSEQAKNKRNSKRSD